MYKTASHFFQRFKESTGKDAFNLWIPVRERKKGMEDIRSGPSSGTIYSSWMRSLLQRVANCQKRILIVTPNLKLSLVRPFLLALPRREIEITVLTKFGIKDFRLASDLAAIELLVHRPAVPGLTRLFVMTSWHEQVFVIDDDTVVWGPHGLETKKRGLRFKLYQKDGALAKQVYLRVREQLNSGHKIGEATVEQMRSQALNSPAVLEAAGLVIELDPSEVIKLDFQPVLDSDDVAELQITEPIEELARRDIAIQDFAIGLENPDLNGLAGRPFESPCLSWEQPALLIEAARRDVERIKQMSLTSLGLNNCPVDYEAIVTPFIHQTWCEWLKKEIVAHGLQSQLFSPLGKLLIQLEVALHFTSQLPYDASTAGPASVATHGVIPFLDYLTPLESNGIRVLLNRQDADLGKGWAREQFEAVVGLQYFYRGHRVVREYVMSCLKNDLTSQQVMDSPSDFKTILQNFAQIDRQTPRYTTERAGGEDHDAVFVSTVSVGKRSFQPARGLRKREAEVNAAREALAELTSETRNLAKYERAVRLTMGSTKIPLWKYSLSRTRETECSELGRRLGLQVGKKSYLLDLALTHVSWVREHPETRSYQRLAFIGSYIAEILLLEDCIREFGWQVPGRGRESYLSKRHIMVSHVLVAVFGDLHLDRNVRAVSNVSTTDSVKADVVQSLLAAAFLQGGLEASRVVWNKWIQPRTRVGEETQHAVDAITALQQVTQGQNGTLPVYDTERDPGSPGHKQKFYAVCRVDGEVLGRGQGYSKKDAKQMAALQALSKLKQNNSAN